MEKRERIETLKGTIENVVYHNESNDYTVLEIVDGEDNLITAVGVIPMAAEGEIVRLCGRWTYHKEFGKQFAFDKVISRLHPGAVILLHSVSPDNANALGLIIDEARSQGYEFLSLRDYVSN